MINHVLAGVALIGTVSGVASAQTYISVSPPPAAFAPPSVISPRLPTTVAPSPGGDQRGVTIQTAVDKKDNTAGMEKPRRYNVSESTISRLTP